METITSKQIVELLKKKDLLFYSSHDKLSLPIINRISKKMAHGIKFDAIKVCDNLIIDGHHRYISSVLTDKKIEIIKSAKSSATKIYNWNQVDFVAEEWDTKAKIFRLNAHDALYNDIPIEKIENIIK